VDHKTFVTVHAAKYEFIFIDEKDIVLYIRLYYI